MNIKIKRYDGKFLFLMNDECLYKELLDDLEKFLESSLFEKSDYYPKAFFDFKSRFLNENDIISLLKVLNEKRKVIFNGFKSGDNQIVDIYSHKVRNGDCVHVFNKTLFLEKINPGATIYCLDDIYFLNSVKGHIISYNDQVKICGHCFENAMITICGKVLQEVTFFELTSVYYKDNQLCIRKENNDEQDYCRNFW